ncbi:hypothetical protein [Actinacidiphila rubida]|uniref:WXG100 family type VII secretion target n=1 Tax=Actinacidiphila rubida TaxID=310780 RepID=A0A1H8P684_9ACTN|nr:hypothetical protein [Actinacidiphila rubida]SEO37449.1 hypothetical protein SAMN05216267_1024136 [Actinacidiphila rubida]
MTDLKVSYDTLEESASHLKAIQRELDDTKHHQADIKDSLGSHDMAHAMHDFASNWDYHRHKLLDKIQAMGEMTEKTLEAFKDVDKKLQDGLTEHKHSDGGTTK